MSGPQAFQALRCRSALSASRSPSKSHTHSHTLHTPVGPAAPPKPLHGGLLGVADTLTRPAADAGPWGRAARALPACKGGRAREGSGMGEAAGGEERRQHRGGRRGARRGGRGGAGAGARGGAHVWAAVRARYVGGRVGEERRGRLGQPSSTGGR